MYNTDIIKTLKISDFISKFQFLFMVINNPKTKSDYFYNIFMFSHLLYNHSKELEDKLNSVSPLDLGCRYHSRTMKGTIELSKLETYIGNIITLLEFDKSI